MTARVGSAYTKRQWFWSVMLAGGLAAFGIFLVSALSSFGHALALLPYYIIVSLAISWVFVAPALAIAMKSPATYFRAGLWGVAAAGIIAFAGFCVARLLANGQLGSGEQMQMKDGVLTPYGWQQLIQRNLIFVAYGTGIALIIRAIIGPGRRPE